MSPVTAGFIGIAVLIVAFIIRIPVAFAMMIVGLAGSLYLLPANAAFRFLATDVFDRFSSYPLSVIPMFMLMGYFAAATGMTTRLYKVAYAWIGWIRGGLSLATIMANALFAAVCGSSAASAATFGKVAYPEMKKYKYDDSLATGSIAGAGTLGPMIPPSGGLIVYGIITEQSITDLFLAAILPGIMLAVLFVIGVYALCRRNPNLGPPGPKTSRAEKIRALPGIIEVGGLFALAIGGLFAGLFTPTQAGSVGAAGALLIGFMRRTLTSRAIWDATVEAVEISCMVLCLITGAVVFGHFLSLSKIPIFLTDWVGSLAVPRIVVLMVVCLFYIVGGCFLDALGLMVVSLPIIYPVLASLGYDLIWFGIITGFLAETGVLTPPVGVNVYVIKGIVPQVPLGSIFRGVVPFIIMGLIALVIVIAFPQIALFLPSVINP